jgi:hypothetical protein
MRGRWRAAVPIVLVVAAGCGGPPAGTRTITAAGASRSDVVAAEQATTTTAITAPTTVKATGAVPGPTTTTRPVSPPTTVRRPTTATTPPAATTPPVAPYAPGPPPPGVLPDGYGGYGGVTTTSTGGTTVTLHVYAREQYLGEQVQVRAEASTAGIVTSIRFDFGDGHVVAEAPLPNWYCSTQVRDAPAAANYVYPAPGRYTVAVIVTVAPCTFMPGPPGLAGPGVPTGPPVDVRAGIDVLQRADPPPRPVGPSPGA